MYLFGSSRFTKTCDPTVFSKMSLLNNETITNGVEKVKNLDDWIDRGSIFNKPSLFQDSVRSFTTSGDLSAKNMNKLMKIFEGRMKSILKEVKFVVKKRLELEYLLGFGILTMRVAYCQRHQTFRLLEGGYPTSSKVGVAHGQEPLGDGQQIDCYTS